jgi:hypothetical protein
MDRDTCGRRLLRLIAFDIVVPTGILVALVTPMHRS